MMRILLTGGGTGGHIYPLVAVARAIKKIRPETQLYFLGPTHFGRKELEAEGVRVYHLVMGKFRRYLDPRWLLDIVKTPVGFLQALGIVFWVMPDVVLAKGGYGSAAVALVSRFFRIPVVIHESDSIPGLTNRLLGRFARDIIISFPEAKTGFRTKDHAKIRLVGNPVRSELALGSVPEAKTALGLAGGRPTLAVLGGSQGAERLNDLFLLTLPELLKSYEVIHQTGALNHERVVKEGSALIPKELRSFWHPRAFFDEATLTLVYAGSDLIVSRAGAGAVFEIAAAGKPSILIPLDKGSRGEQIKNAYAYARSGAALVLEEANLSEHIFVKTVGDLMADVELRQKMAAAAKQFAKPEAAQRIAEAILSNIKN